MRKGAARKRSGVPPLKMLKQPNDCPLESLSLLRADCDISIHGRRQATSMLGRFANNHVIFFASDGSCSSRQQDYFKRCSSFVLCYKRLQECTQRCWRCVHSLYHCIVSGADMLLPRVIPSVLHVHSQYLVAEREPRPQILGRRLCLSITFWMH
jgi:hypothetical protein